MMAVHSLTLGAPYNNEIVKIVMMSFMGLWWARAISNPGRIM